MNMIVFLIVVFTLLFYRWLGTWFPYWFSQILTILSNKKPVIDAKDEACVPRALVKLRKKLEKLRLKK